MLPMDSMDLTFFCIFNCSWNDFAPVESRHASFSCPETSDHCRRVFITYIDHGIGYDKLIDEMREICGFHKNYPFTVKWVDEEGDPCTVSSQIELDEAIRLYEINKEAELTVHGRKITLRRGCSRIRAL